MLFKIFLFHINIYQIDMDDLFSLEDFSENQENQLKVETNSEKKDATSIYTIKHHIEENSNMNLIKNLILNLLKSRSIRLLLRSQLLTKKKLIIMMKLRFPQNIIKILKSCILNKKNKFSLLKI